MPAVSKGLATTFRVLAQTDNEAAIPLLLSTLESPHEKVQEGALATLLSRRDPMCQREILRRMPNLSENWKQIIRQHPGQMTQFLRDTLLGTDLSECRKACQAAVWFADFDLIPTLLTVLEDETSPNADQAAATLNDLVNLLYEELASTQGAQSRRDPQTIRRNVVASLEKSINRFARHKRRNVIEAFLPLVPRDNTTLKQILENPHHPVFLAVVEILSTSSHGGVIRLLLSFLDDAQASSAGLSVIGKRSDLRMVQYFLRKIGREPSGVVARNIKRLTMIPWLSSTENILNQLDATAQHSAVRLAVDSGISRQQAYSVVEYILLSGKPAGRREAARALAVFPGAEANSLALKVLQDPDPHVQANVLLQLRHRGIPGILPRLVEKVDSRHALVRRAARECLVEFSFKRFLATFDILDEKVRHHTGMLVKKIDPRSVPLLREEMNSPMRTRRLRALTIARTMELVEQLEERIVELLQDEDHMVRLEAATALAMGTSDTSRQALEDALNDRSGAVQEAARKSLFRSRTGGRTSEASKPGGLIFLSDANCP
jgi:HEAT repeat protein